MKVGDRVLYSGFIDRDGNKWPGGRGRVVRIYKSAGTISMAFDQWPKVYVEMNNGNTPRWMNVPINAVKVC